MAQAPAPTVILPHPQSAVQAGIAVAHDAIGSLAGQPVVLLLAMVNIAFLLAGGYFLSRLEETRSNLMITTLDIVKTCVVDRNP